MGMDVIIIRLHSETGIWRKEVEKKWQNLLC